MSSRTSFQFNEQQARTLIEYQGQANDVMSTAWRDPATGNDTIPYYRAANIELFESIVEIGFKWWKGEQAYSTSKVIQELVDALHFVISDHIRHKINRSSRPEESALSICVSSLTGIPTPEISKIGRLVGARWTPDMSELSLVDICEQALYDYLLTGKASIGWLAILFERLGVSPDQIFGYYLAKNTLNKFRTANGNGEGTYDQIWADREDSDFLQDFVEQTVEKGEPISVESIESYLGRVYTELRSDGYTKRK